MAELNEIAEVAADGVADGMHIVGEEALAAEEVVRSMDKLQLSYIALGVVVGAAAGSLIAWKFAYKRAETKAEKIIAEEVAQMREHFHAKERAREEQAEKVQPLKDKVEELGYTPAPVQRPTTPSVPVQEPPRPIPEQRNVFEAAQTDDVWDYNSELKFRETLHPMVSYVIHKDEVGENDEYEQETLTYYEEDDILTDHKDDILDQDETIGLQNLNHFGHGSKDANIVYIRNPEKMIEFEVIKTKGSFAQVVHGFDPPEDIRHAHQRRFRPDDE